MLRLVRPTLIASLSFILACNGPRDDGAAVSTPPASTSAPALAAQTSVVLPAGSAPSASASANAPARTDPWLEKTLRAADARWAGWLKEAEALRLQILVTVVEPGAAAWPSHELRVDAEYFYPASAVKTLLAVASLRVLSERVGGPIDLLTRIMRCRDDRPGCEPPVEDEDAELTDDGKKKHKKLRVGEEITKMLSYSDNDSYNRLYDAIGHRELNEEIAKLGLGARFHHRMNAPAERSRFTPRVTLLPPGKRAFEAAGRTSNLEPAPTPASGLAVGTAYKDHKGLVEEPLSFAKKNYVSLRELHRVHLSLLSPDRPEAVKLGLDEAQRSHITRAMTLNLAAVARAAEHGPLSPGVLEVLPAKRIRYVAKSGRAYGFHLENAFIEDTETGRGFFVTAVVYSNPDGVMNDDDYGYDETTRPLLASLGAALTRALLVSAP